MKTKYKSSLVILFMLLVLLSRLQCQQPDPNQVTQQPTQQNQTQPEPTKNDTQPQPPKPLDHVPIDLDKPYPQQLTKEMSFSQKYRVKVTPEQVNNLSEQKWFLFIDLETAQEYQWQKTKIQLFSINSEGRQKPLKECDSSNGLDSCFLTNNNFDYKTQSIQATVTCGEYCKFTISAQISAKYKLQPDSSLQLNFQNTAYSKLFTLDTSQLFDFKRLQIVLKPKGFLSFNAPIRLYANKGVSIPTRQKHDYAGIHLWDDGLGIFINYPDASTLFTILIQGPEKNILILETKVIYEQKPITTFRYEPSFSFLQSQQKQLFQIPINKSQHTIIKLTTLTGSIQMNAVKDQSLKQVEIEFTPLSRSYGELQYKFEPSFYENNKNANIIDKLYIQIKANKDSTFVFESYTNNDEMNCLVAEVNRYADLEKSGVDLYYLKLFEFQENVNQNNKAAKIQVMTTTYDYVDLGTRFFLCRAHKVEECQPSPDQISKLKASNDSIDSQKRKQIKNIGCDASMPGVRYYNLQIDYNDFLKNQTVFQVYVIVVITNPQKDEQILYTLQYINMGETYFLKEKQLRRDRVSIDEIKYYTFVNNDKDVKSIKVHSIEISGQILMVGYKEDPRSNELQGKEIYEYYGSVNFLNVQPGEQFFVMVQGIENAYYSLYLQLIRQSESEPVDKTNSEGYNEIIVQENPPYDFFIKPKENIIVQLHSTVPEFQLIIGSNLPLELCMTEILDQPPFKPNCEIKQTLTKNQRMGIKMDKGLIGNIGVTNNNDKAVELKIQMIPFHKQQQCQQSAPGLLNKFTLISVIDASKQTSNLTEKKVQCFRMNLNRRQNLQIMVELENMLYENTTITWQLNGKEKELMLDTRHLIWKKQMLKVCGPSEKDECILEITIESNYSTDGIMLVQYLDKDLILLEGVAQPAFVELKITEVKRFRYEMINLVNTTILLQNKAGYYHFYGQVYPRVQFLKSENRNSLYPSEQNHLFKSENPFYFVYQTYILTEDQLKNSTCKQECVLLISVYPARNEQPLEDMGRFVIEVSQQDRYLKENQPMMGYLERGSLAFYEYYNPQKGTIFVQLNNQNMKCAKIFIKKGNQTRATPSSYDKMTDNQNELIYEDAEPGPYAITLEAKHSGCSYSVQAVSSIVNLQKLKRGIFSDKTLAQGQTYHFLYEHYRNESFKVLTLNKVGQLVIKLKVLYGGELNTLLTTNGTQTLNQYLSNLAYQQTGIDYLKVHHQKSLFFCVDCTYLISITANKYTETSVIIPSRDVQIPIITNALIKDEVKAKETMKFRIFTSNIAQYQLYVQYGELNLTIAESVSGKQVLSKIYSQTKEPIYEKFNSSTGKSSELGFGYDFIHYSVITIEGIANSSMYTFELLSDQDKSRQEGNIKYGIPEYFFLEANKAKCFKGTIDDDSEQFIISFDDSTLETVKNLTITAKVKDQKVDYKTNYGVREMTLEINELKLSEPASYEICLQSNETVSLTFIQSAHIMMVPSDTSVLLTRPANLTFGSKGSTILEVDECSTRSVISVSSTFNDLHTSQSEILQVRRANNLVEFNHWGPVYVHIQTEGTRFRWRHKDSYKDLGMGYDNFIGGTATAFKEENVIKIEAKPIEQIGKYNKNTSFSVQSVTYKIILGRYEKQVLSSLNCQEQNVIKYEHETESLNSSAVATFPITQQMKQKLSQMKFFLVGVIANLNLHVNGVIENYRFVYPMVEIQREVFFGGDVKPKPADESNIKREDSQKQANTQSLNYLLITAGIILLALVLLYVYKKYLRRCLRSRRQRLSDQGSASFKYTEFASMQD